MRRIFSDLNLNGDSPVRVQPEVGQWPPARVPTTAQKKKARLQVSAAFAGLTVALFLLGDFFYKTLMGIT